MPYAMSNPKCLQAGLKQECLNDLQSKCQNSGLASIASSASNLDSGVPNTCDANAQG
jgi:hypothetical protein